MNCLLFAIAVQSLYKTRQKLKAGPTTSTLTPGRSKIVFDSILETDPLLLRLVVTKKELLVGLVSCFYAGKMSTIVQIHVFIHSKVDKALLLMNLDQKKHHKIGSSSRLSIIQMFGMKWNEMFSLENKQTVSISPALSCFKKIVLLADAAEHLLELTQIIDAIQ